MPLEENKNFLNEKREHPKYEPRIYEPKPEVEKVIVKKKKEKVIIEKKNNNNDNLQQSLF